MGLVIGTCPVSAAPVCRGQRDRDVRIYLKNCPSVARLRGNVYTGAKTTVCQNQRELSGSGLHRSVPIMVDNAVETEGLGGFVDELVYLQRCDVSNIVSAERKAPVAE